MEKADEEQKRLLEAERNTLVLALEKSQSETQIALLEASGKTVVAQLSAIQPELIAAIEGLGNKQVLGDLAKHLPQATGELGFLLGQGGMAGLKRFVEGTALGDLLTKLGQSTTVAQITAGGTNQK